MYKYSFYLDVRQQIKSNTEIKIVKNKQRKTIKKYF